MLLTDPGAAFERPNMGDRLMSVTPTDIVFAEATPEQQLLAWTLNGVSWAAPMAIADYVKREAYLASSELAKNGGTRYWVLHLKGKPDDIIASCESTRKKFLIRRPGEDVQTETAYGESPSKTRRSIFC